MRALIASSSTLALRGSGRFRRGAPEKAEAMRAVRGELDALGADLALVESLLETPPVPISVMAHFLHAEDAHRRAEAAWQRAETLDDLSPATRALEEGHAALDEAHMHFARKRGIRPR